MDIVNPPARATGDQARPLQAEHTSTGTGIGTDTEVDPLMDGLIALAAQACDTPIALLCVTERDRQWFTSRMGLQSLVDTVQAYGLCALAVWGEGLMEVEDLTLDPRFQHKVLPQGEPLIRFGAALPLWDEQGASLGVLCVIDTVPRSLSEPQRQALAHVASLGASLLSRRKADLLAMAQQRRLALLAAFDGLSQGDIDPESLMARAVEVAHQGTGFARSKLSTVAQGAHRLEVKAAVGWPRDIQGRVIDDVDDADQARQALMQCTPVVAHHAGSGRGVCSGITVAIPGPAGPVGVLGVHADQPDAMSPELSAFVQGLANSVGLALTRRQTSERLAYLAQFDALTGLPNRHLFRDSLAQSLIRAARHSQSVAVMVLNLDGFQLINSKLGHAAGDQLLVQVARRLRGTIRADDHLSRRGGDEFGMVLTDLGHADDMAQIVQKILAELARPCQLDGQDIFLSASAGVSMFAADGSEADALIQKAEMALQRAKEQGRNTVQFYAPEMNARVEQRLRLESSLHHALNRGEFLLHYQPKLSTSSDRPCSAEALLRWRHPEEGVLGPQAFIPILEETGLIVQVGLWVLAEACAQLRRWDALGLHVSTVAVNLSARQFRQADLVARIQDIMAGEGIDPRRIELEITESMLMRDPEAAAIVLGQLKDLGVQLSVDDFGTGYSSLAYLKQFPLNALKIDRAFICSIPQDPDDAAITLAIINLAHNLKLKVVAEGVETEEQARFLMAHGCDVLQGFHFSRPVDAQTFLGLMRDGQSLRLPAPLTDTGC